MLSKKNKHKLLHDDNNVIFLILRMTHSYTARTKESFLPPSKTEMQTPTCLLWLILSKCRVHTCLTTSSHTLEHKSGCSISSPLKMISHASHPLLSISHPRQVSNMSVTLEFSGREPANKRSGNVRKIHTKCQNLRRVCVNSSSISALNILCYL